MNGPDYRTAAEYWRDKAWSERRARLDGTETTDDEEPDEIDEASDDAQE